MWRAPNRPNHEITQDYNDGVVTVCAVRDAAPAGFMPKEELVEKYKLLYSEQRVGVTRFNAARQNQINVERVLRVQRVAGITNQDVAITHDGTKYRIDQVQTVPDVYPPSLDLTLTLYTQGADGHDMV